MSKVYTCRDIGMECEWGVSAETVGEILLLIGEHVAAAHNITDTASELLKLVMEAINDEPCHRPSFPGSK